MKSDGDNHREGEAPAEPKRMTFEPVRISNTAQQELRPPVGQFLTTNHREGEAPAEPKYTNACERRRSQDHLSGNQWPACLRQCAEIIIQLMWIGCGYKIVLQTDASKCESLPLAYCSFTVTAGVF
jgi:hypothetical protein